jgi:segregation and condensation protein B
MEAIRGVNCGEIVRQLMERDLVRISGRSDELGRPYLYSTTRRFLQIFGLVSLDELPRAADLRNAPLPSAPWPSRLDTAATANMPDEKGQSADDLELSERQD